MTNKPAWCAYSGQHCPIWINPVQDCHRYTCAHSLTPDKYDSTGYVNPTHDTTMAWVREQFTDGEQTT